MGRFTALLIINAGLIVHMLGAARRVPRDGLRHRIMHKEDISQGSRWLSDMRSLVTDSLCYTFSQIGKGHNSKWIARDISCIYLASDSNILRCDILLVPGCVTIVDEMDTRIEQPLNTQQQLEALLTLYGLAYTL
ncbi:hypothetical protein J3E68DRAFT_314511 [Trichoderma sp. SZMC 28012]